MIETQEKINELPFAKESIRSLQQQIETLQITLDRKIHQYNQLTREHEELKIEFEWREADKDLAKEERNTPIDLAKQPVNDFDALLAMETRSWKSGSGDSEPDAPEQNAPTRQSRPQGSRRNSSSRPGGAGRGRSAGRRRRG